MNKNFKKGTPEQFMNELQAKIAELGGSIESCDSVMSADEPADASDERYIHSLTRAVEDALGDEVDSIQWGSTKDGAVNFVVCYMGHVLDYAVPLSDLKMDFDSMDEDADYIANTVLQDLDNLGDEEDITSSVSISSSIDTKSVLDFLGSKGYDTSSDDVKNYADAVAEYIDMSDEDYPLDQWYKDTQMNYPEDLEELPRVDSCVNCSSEAITGSTYSWSDFEEFNRALDTYMPSSGEGDTMASQVCTAVAKLIYKWFNDGDVFDNTHGLEGWANDLSDYANWLYKYIPQSKMILERIYRCYTEDDYTSLLWDLAEATLDLEDVSALEDVPKKGSVYHCDGPFKFEEYSDEDDDGYDDDYYGHY